VDEEEREQGTDRGQISKKIDREKTTGGSTDETSDSSGNDGGLVLGVELSSPGGEEAIKSHGEKDTGLSNQEDKHDRNQTSQDTDLAKDGEPLATTFVGNELEGSLSNDVLVVDNTSHDKSSRNVQDSASNQGNTDRDGQITLGVAGFLSSGTDGIETCCG